MVLQLSMGAAHEDVEGRADDGEGISPGEAALFTEQVLPVLEQACFKCHGPDARRLKGGLLMDGTDSLLIGGESGPAIVPGEAESSPLIRYVRWLEPTMEMPPKTQLSDESIELLAAWVNVGAPWPGGVERATPEGTIAPHVETGSDARGGAQPVFTPETLQWFEQEVRPLLGEHCFSCHGPRAERLKGGLRMSHTGALYVGGESGPAVDRDDPAASLLLRAVRYEGGLEMPPSGRLSDTDVALLTEWVQRGAPMPPPPDDIAELDAAEVGIDMEAGRNWWAYKPVRRPELPSEVSDGQPIDAFIASRLASAGLTAASRAEDRTLVIRATLDLTGLPPTYEEVVTYVADTTPDKWERLIERLLRSPRYGEHWGRMWLDVVRFAQSNGYEKDHEKPLAWRYRDYVIESFNADKPYDVFLSEQLAGDELDRVTDASIIATGFYRLGAWDNEPDDSVQARYDGYDDVLRVIGEGMMGVTVGCARCHDHKFDPVRQTDYFGLLSFIENVRPYQDHSFSMKSPTLMPLSLDQDSKQSWEAARQLEMDEIKARLGALYEERWREVIVKRLGRVPLDVEAALDVPASERSLEELAVIVKFENSRPSRSALRKSFDPGQRREYFLLKESLSSLVSSYEGNLEWALTVKELSRFPPPSRLHVRGEARTPGDMVPTRFLPALCPDDQSALPPEPQPSDNYVTSGRRRLLADWITSAAHPTTARVMANRVWQGHFNQGLVSTPNDFGTAGAPPSHPDLLDWLASEFVENGWSLKHLHRLIMKSEAYRRSSLRNDQQAEETDPDNSLLWRQNLHRLKAEQIRDSVLAVSGSLSLEMGGRGFFENISREALSGNNRPGDGWGLSDAAQRSRRSIYMYAKRGMPAPLLSALDLANSALSTGRRSSTTVASQSLSLLNSDFMNAQARQLAQRVEREAGADVERQLERLFELVLARRPEAQELKGAWLYLRSQAEAFAALPTHLRVRSKVPDRLDVRFLSELAGTDILYGPKTGWTYLKGAWGNPYNGTKESLKDLGPSLLLEGPVVTDAVLSGRFLLTAGCAFGAVQMRLQAQGDHARGLSAVFDPIASEVRLVEWAGAPADPTQETGRRVLARAAVPLLPDTWYRFRMQVDGRRLRLALEGEILLDVEVESAQPGQVGVQQWGETMELDDLVLHSVELPEPLRILPDMPASPEQRALESLCLALLNTNEFLTVD